ncbi:MAG: restriction endonuclease [Alphaproteobacteria bacterium]|nr:restriction endonuclease [Alphaproteobacteria bacterium]
MVSAIAGLPRNRFYNYVNEKTRGHITIVSLERPEGPIAIKRFNPKKGGTEDTAEISHISSNMLWRLANNLVPGTPVNVDRVFGGSYNTRSVLEALLAHTPQIYTCLPGRIEVVNSGKTEVKRGHKHIVWLPDRPHENGVMKAVDTDMIISELPPAFVVYDDALDIPPALQESAVDIETQRRHTQIQICLIKIGAQLGFRTWVASNDRGIIYQEQRIGEMPSVIGSLSQESMLRSYSEATEAAKLIDVLWFKNGTCMPAVMEIEHSTGVTSGLTRMKKFYDKIPKYQDVRWAIVAPDEIRDKVLTEANNSIFKPLDVRFFPYSAVEELYYLCSRRKISGIDPVFLDSFMEKCVN